LHARILEEHPGATIEEAALAAACLAAPPETATMMRR
jgi:hypothetical protein